MTMRGWILMALGVWLVVASYLPLGRRGQELDGLIVGFIVTNVGLSMLHRKPALAWAAGVLGVWVFVSAFIPVLVSGSGLCCNNGLIGAVIAVVGYMSTRHGHDTETTDGRVFYR